MKALSILLALCGVAYGSCPNGIRVRKEFRDMTSTEWNDFKDALIRLVNDPKYHQYSSLHMQYSRDAHQNPQFLPWHRLFLADFEKDLQRFNPNVMLPYWDWTFDSQDPISSPIFEPEYLGIEVGPQGDCSWRMRVPRTHCLVRNYDPEDMGTFHSATVIDGLVTRRSTYDQFRSGLEISPHGNVHVVVGGSGGDMSRMQSPNDPLFWLHHGFVDKIWADRQKNTRNTNQYDGRFGGRTVSLTDIMAPFNKPASAGFSTTDLCYRYQPFSQRMTSSGLEVIPEKEVQGTIKAPKPLPDEWIHMLGLPVEQVRAMEQELNDMIPVPPIVKAKEEGVKSHKNAIRNYLHNRQGNSRKRKNENPLSSIPDLPTSEADMPAVLSDDEVNTPFIEDEDNEGEDLFDDRMARDYAEIPHMDTYDSQDIDDDDYEPLEANQRNLVDAMLNQRDVDMARRRGRIPEAFLPDVAEGIDFVESKRAQAQLDYARRLEQDEDEDEEMATDALTEAESAGYPLQEFVLMDTYRRRIMKDFQKFLVTFVDENGQNVYLAKIRAMCSDNKESLEVSYMHLQASNAFLAKLVANIPYETFKIFDEATMRIVLGQFEDYDRIKSEIHVRMIELPVMDNLRDLRFNHLNTLVRVSGVVTRRSGVFPQLKLVKFDCVKCGSILGPFYQDLNEEIKIGSCSECESRGPFSINVSQTIYRNYQRMTLQESPGSIPAGRLPRHKEIILLWDLIDSARPGEEVEVIGIYRNNFSYALNTKNGFPVFATVIEANSIGKKEDLFAGFRLTEDDQREIRRLSADPKIGQRIAKSIAPSIYGHDNIKTAIALSMFGGQSKNIQGKHQLRGDINVLLLGDPGTAKSQFLKYVEKTAHRAIFTTGQGASAVGLTASVRKDPVTREWTLEGGALVLADKGICLIDEFDKMNDADRTSIHEAMEQQSISISKAGIVTTLQARCAIIAAANPVRGRYNSSLPFSQNVELTEPILSRFDVLCVVKDVVDPVNDELLAKFVVGSHIRSHPNGSDSGALADNVQQAFSSIEPIPQDLLKKYIMYAKSKIRPQISQMDIDKVSKLYADLRKESLSSGSIPITVRHIESIVRMAEASAKMHLREFVRSDDIDLAIRVCLESFISAQKYSITKHLRKAFSKYISYQRDNFELLYFLLQEMVRETSKYYQYRYEKQQMPKKLDIEAEDFEIRAKELGVHDIRPFYSCKLFVSSGFKFDSARKIIEKDF